MIKNVKTIALFILGLSGSVAFASIAGQKIEPAKDANGSLRFGVQFSTSSNMVAITFSVKGADLVGASPSTVSPAQWAILDKSTGSFISPWVSLNSSAGFIDPASNQAFTVSVPNASAATVAKVFKSSVIAIAIKDGSKNPTPTQFIDIGELCTSSPEKFMNLDTFSQGCD